MKDSKEFQKWFREQFGKEPKFTAEDTKELDAHFTHYMRLVRMKEANALYKLRWDAAYKGFLAVKK